MKRAILILSCLCLFTPMAFAQIGSPARKTPADPRVKTALDELGYKFELTDDNDYKLMPIETEQSGTTADGKPIFRNQLVYVNSKVEKYGTLEIREVLSPAFLSNGPLSAAVANRLLRENDSVKLGSWRLVVLNNGASAGKYLAMYAAQIAADSDAESLRLTIKSVILIADRMERELTGTDDY